MSHANILAAVTAMVGFAFAVVGVVKYSNFITRLQEIAPTKVEALALDPTENWSKGNWNIGLYFWQKAYLGEDPELNCLGNSVRNCNLLAFISIGAAGVIFLLGGNNG